MLSHSLLTIFLYHFPPSLLQTSGALNNQSKVGPVLPLTLKKLPERIDTWIAANTAKPIYYMCMGTIATLSSEMIKPLVLLFTFTPVLLLNI